MYISPWGFCRDEPSSCCGPDIPKFLSFILDVGGKWRSIRLKNVTHTWGVYPGRVSVTARVWYSWRTSKRSQVGRLREKSWIQAQVIEKKENLAKECDHEGEVKWEECRQGHLSTTEDLEARKQTVSGVFMPWRTDQDFGKQGCALTSNFKWSRRPFNGPVVPLLVT